MHEMKDKFAQINSKTGVIEIIDVYTGAVVAVQRDPHAIYTTDIFAQHLMPTGELVLLQKGVDPGLLARTQAHPFSQITADIICQKIAEGGSLTAICKLAGMPPYNILARWRRDHPSFSRQLVEAKEDRAEYLRDCALREAEEAVSTKDPVNASALRIDTYKWLAGVDDQKYSPRSKIEATISTPMQLIVSTGIVRTEPTAIEQLEREVLDARTPTNPGETGAPKAQVPGPLSEGPNITPRATEIDPGGGGSTGGQTTDDPSTSAQQGNLLDHGPSTDEAIIQPAGTNSGLVSEAGGNIQT